MSTPSEQLLTKSVNGWLVVEELGTFPGASGGNFSTGYIVEKDGVRAYMKAMDLHSVVPHGISAIAATASQFSFEKDILEFCTKENLSGVVRLLEAGELANQSAHPFDIIYYMVFEKADGDIRRELFAFGGQREASWKLSVLHQSAKALLQLHGVDIAHQDLKPSNVLAFRSTLQFKLADLGRAVSKQFRAPADTLDYPGDRSYAPPEYIYGFVPPAEYQDRRIGSDAFLLGSLLSFLFAGVGSLTLTLKNLPPQCMPGSWTGTYNDLLPYLVNAHTQATANLYQSWPPGCAAELSQAYFNLCHPNPSTRGHPDARKQSRQPVGLDRYRSIFDRLRLRCEIEERAELKRIKKIA